MPQITPRTKQAYELFHEGSLALAEAEFNGIRVDREYLETAIALQTRLAKRLEAKLADSEMGKLWRKRYGTFTKFGSDDQLRQILFGDMGLTPVKMTKGGKTGLNKQASVDEDSLLSYNLPDLALFLRKRGAEQMASTFLKNIYNESAYDGYLHPFFHLSSYDEETEGGARSFRSSSSHPNFQNFPNREEEERKLIRSAIIPRPGNRLVGRDYGGVEVCSSCCNHQDKNMIRYIEKGDDMHRDCASMVFMLPPELCTKAHSRWGGEVRQAGKNQYVFPQFYLQEPTNTAKGIWAYMVKMNLKYPLDPEKSLQQYLKEKGIHTYEAFEKHVLKVIDGFWTSMFPGYGAWRKKHIENYTKNGYFDMLTGFRVEGVLSPYQLGNYPIQGVAFHWLLWSFIQTHHLWRGKRSSGWRSLLIGQIHDEQTSDEPDAEFWENQKVIPKIMTQDIRKHWDWICVPLDVETDATPVDGNWYTKKKIKGDKPE